MGTPLRPIEDFSELLAARARVLENVRRLREAWGGVPGGGGSGIMVGGGGTSLMPGAFPMEEPSPPIAPPAADTRNLFQRMGEGMGPLGPGPLGPGPVTAEPGPRPPRPVSRARGTSELPITDPRGELGAQGGMAPDVTAVPGTMPAPPGVLEHGRDYEAEWDEIKGAAAKRAWEDEPWRPKGTFKVGPRGSLTLIPPETTPPIPEMGPVPIAEGGATPEGFRIPDYDTVPPGFVAGFMPADVTGIQPTIPGPPALPARAPISYPAPETTTESGSGRMFASQFMPQPRGRAETLGEAFGAGLEQGGAMMGRAVAAPFRLGSRSPILGGVPGAIADHLEKLARGSEERALQVPSIAESLHELDAYGDPSKLKLFAAAAITQGVISSLPSVAGGLVGGGLGASLARGMSQAAARNVITTWATMGARLASFPMNYADARQQLEQEGITGLKGDVLATPAAVVMSWLDGIMPGHIGAEAAERAIREIPLTLAQQLKYGASEAAFGFGTEFITEGLQVVPPAAMASLVTGKELLSPELFEQMAEEAAAGGLTGGVMGGGATVAGTVAAARGAPIPWNPQQRADEAQAWDPTLNRMAIERTMAADEADLQEILGEKRLDAAAAQYRRDRAALETRQQVEEEEALLPELQAQQAARRQEAMMRAAEIASQMPGTVHGQQILSREFPDLRSDELAAMWGEASASYTPRSPKPTAWRREPRQASPEEREARRAARVTRVQEVENRLARARKGTEAIDPAALQGEIDQMLTEAQGAGDRAATDRLARLAADIGDIVEGRETLPQARTPEGKFAPKPEAAPTEPVTEPVTEPPPEAPPAAETPTAPPAEEAPTEAAPAPAEPTEDPAERAAVLADLGMSEDDGAPFTLDELKEIQQETEAELAAQADARKFSPVSDDVREQIKDMVREAGGDPASMSEEDIEQLAREAGFLDEADEGIEEPAAPAPAPEPVPEPEPIAEPEDTEDTYGLRELDEETLLQRLAESIASGDRDLRKAVRAEVQRREDERAAATKPTAKPVKKGGPVTAAQGQRPYGQYVAEEPPRFDYTDPESAAEPTTVMLVDRNGKTSTVEAYWRVAELDDLTSSHLRNPAVQGQGEPNPEYPAGPQNREAIDWRRVDEIAAPGNFDLERLFSAYLSDDPIRGSLITDDRGVVFGGNHRTEILRVIYGRNDELAGRVRDRMIEEAIKAGVDEARIEGFKRPVLVRVLANTPQSTEEAARIGDQSNRPFSASIGEKEDALGAAREFSQETLDFLANTFDDSKGKGFYDYLRSEKGQEFTRRLLKDGVIPSDRMTKYVDPDGNLNDVGWAYVERAVMARAFTDIDALNKAPTDKGRRAGLVHVSPIVASIGGQYEIRTTLSDAVRLLGNLKLGGVQDIKGHLLQPDLLGDPHGWKVRQLAYWLHKTGASKDIRAAFQGYAAEAKESGGREGGESLLPDFVNPDEAFKRAFGSEVYQSFHDAGVIDMVNPYEAAGSWHGLQFGSAQRVALGMRMAYQWVYDLWGSDARPDIIITSDDLPEGSATPEELDAELGHGDIHRDQDLAIELDEETELWLALPFQAYLANRPAMLHELQAAGVLDHNLSVPKDAEPWWDRIYAEIMQAQGDNKLKGQAINRGLPMELLREQMRETEEEIAQLRRRVIQMGDKLTGEERARINNRLTDLEVDLREYQTGVDEGIRESSEPDLFGQAAEPSEEQGDMFAGQRDTKAETKAILTERIRRLERTVQLERSPKLRQQAAQELVRAYREMRAFNPDAPITAEEMRIRAIASGTPQVPAGKDQGTLLHALPATEHGPRVPVPFTPRAPARMTERQLASTIRYLMERQEQFREKNLTQHPTAQQEREALRRLVLEQRRRAGENTDGLRDMADPTDDPRVAKLKQLAKQYVAKQIAAKKLAAKKEAEGAATPAAPVGEPAGQPTGEQKPEGGSPAADGGAVAAQPATPGTGRRPGRGGERGAAPATPLTPEQKRARAKEKAAARRAEKAEAKAREREKRVEEAAAELKAAEKDQQLIAQVKDVPERVRQLMFAAAKSAGIAVELATDQIVDVARIIRRHATGKAGMLVANGTGTGKTFVALGFIKSMAPKRGIIVVPNQAIAANWVKAAKEHFELDITLNEVPSAEDEGLFIITYPKMLSTEKDHDWGQLDLAIMDEAHKTKNLMPDYKKGGYPKDASKTAIRAAKITDQFVKFRLDLTATPYEYPWHMAYLDHLQLWGEGTKFPHFFDYLRNYGVMVDDEGGLYWEHAAWEDKLAAMMRLRADMIDQGAYTQRALKVDKNLKAILMQVELPDKIKSVRTAVRNALEQAEERLRRMGQTHYIKVLRSFRVTLTRRLHEIGKYKRATELALEYEKKGYNVVVMVGYKKDFRLKRETAMKVPELKVAMDKLEDEDARGIQSLMDALGGPSKVAEITGRVTSPSMRQDNTEEFQNETKHIALATVDAGGTGINLHQRAGATRPRIQINVTAPWTGMVAEQLIGRTYRIGLQGDVVQLWLGADDTIERELLNRMGGKLLALGAMVEGVEKRTAAEIEAWQFLPEQDLEGLLEESLPTLTEGAELVADEDAGEALNDDGTLNMSSPRAQDADLQASGAAVARALAGVSEVARVDPVLNAIGKVGTNAVDPGPAAEGMWQKILRRLGLHREQPYATSRAARIHPDLPLSVLANRMGLRYVQHLIGHTRVPGGKVGGHISARATKPVVHAQHAVGTKMPELYERGGHELGHIIDLWYFGFQNLPGYEEGETIASRAGPPIPPSRLQRLMRRVLPPAALEFKWAQKWVQPYRDPGQAGEWSEKMMEYADELAALDYDQKLQRPFEGFAEFLRLYTTNPQAVESLAFYGFFEQTLATHNPQMLQTLRWIRAVMEHYKRMPPDARILSRVRFLATRDWTDYFPRMSSSGGFLRNMFRWVHDLRMADLAAIDHRVRWRSLTEQPEDGWDHIAGISPSRRALKKWHKKLRQEEVEKLRIAGGLEAFGSALSHDGALAESILNSGWISLRDWKTAAKRGGALPHTGRGLPWVFEPLVGTQKGAPRLTWQGRRISDTEAMDKFKAWQIAMHALELRDKKGATITPIEQKEFEAMIREVHALPEPEQRRMIETSVRLSKFQQEGLDLMVEMDLISRELREKLAEDYPFYISFMRVISNPDRFTEAGGQNTEIEDALGGGTTTQPAPVVRHLYGSMHDLLDPYEGTVANVAHFVQAFRRKRLLNVLEGMAREHAIDQFLERWLEDKPQEHDDYTVKTIRDALRAMNLDATRWVQKPKKPGGFGVAQELKDMPRQIRNDPLLSKQEKQAHADPQLYELVHLTKPLMRSDEKNMILAVPTSTGIPRYYKVWDRNFWNALNGLQDAEPLGWIARPFAWAARALRWGVVMSPEFWLRNALRDLQTEWVQGTGSRRPKSIAHLIPGASLVEHAIHQLNHDDFWNGYLAGGGYASGIIASTRELGRRASLGSHRYNYGGPASAGKSTVMQDFEAAMSVPHNTGDLLRILVATGQEATIRSSVLVGAVSGWSRLGEFVENAPRAREFQRMMAQGASLEAAGFAASNVTTDFSMRGIHPGMRKWTAVTAFLNPFLQGSYRAARQIKDAPMRTAVRSTYAVALTALAYIIERGDDEDDKKIRAADRSFKADYWLFPIGGIIWRIPKTWVYGQIGGELTYELGELTYEALAAMTTEQTLDALSRSKGNQAALDLAWELAGPLVGRVASQVTPNLLKAGLEVGMNQNWYFGNKIDPWKDYNDAPEGRTRSYTSAAAEAVSKWVADTKVGGMRLGNRVVPSPLVLDHLVRSLVGTMGYDIWRAVGAAGAGKPGTEFTVPWARNANRSFFWRGFMADLDGRSTAKLERFIRWQDRMETQAERIQSASLNGEEDRAFDHMSDDPYLLAELAVVNEFNDNFNAIARQMYSPEVRADPDRQDALVRELQTMADQADAVLDTFLAKDPARVRQLAVDALNERLYQRQRSQRLDPVRGEVAKLQMQRELAGERIPNWDAPEIQRIMQYIEQAKADYARTGDARFMMEAQSMIDWYKGRVRAGGDPMERAAPRSNVRNYMPQQQVFK